MNSKAARAAVIWRVIADQSIAVAVQHSLLSALLDSPHFPAHRVRRDGHANYKDLQGGAWPQCLSLLHREFERDCERAADGMGDRLGVNAVLQQERRQYTAIISEH